MQEVLTTVRALMKLYLLGTRPQKEEIKREESATNSLTAIFLLPNNSVPLSALFLTASLLLWSSGLGPLSVLVQTCTLVAVPLHMHGLLGRVEPRTLALTLQKSPVQTCIISVLNPGLDISFH